MSESESPCNTAALPGWTPSRGLRFGLWIGGVVLTLGSPLLGGPLGEPLADAVALLGLGLMLVLLATTPADAIKLPRWASWLIVALGTMWMLGMRLGSTTLSAPDAPAFTQLGTAASIGIGYAALVLIAVGIARAARWVHDLLRPVHHLTRSSGSEPSPWRVVLYAWHPALPMFVIASLGTFTVSGDLIRAILAALALLIAGFAADQSVQANPRLGRAMLAWLCSAGLTAVILMLPRIAA